MDQQSRGSEIKFVLTFIMKIPPDHFSKDFNLASCVADEFENFRSSFGVTPRAQSSTLKKFRPEFAKLHSIVMLEEKIERDPFLHLWIYRIWTWQHFDHWLCERTTYKDVDDSDLRDEVQAEILTEFFLGALRGVRAWLVQIAEKNPTSKIWCLSLSKRNFPVLCQRVLCPFVGLRKRDAFRIREYSMKHGTGDQSVSYIESIAVSEDDYTSNQFADYKLDLWNKLGRLMPNFNERVSLVAKSVQFCLNEDDVNGSVKEQMLDKHGMHENEVSQALATIFLAVESDGVHLL